MFLRKSQRIYSVTLFSKFDQNVVVYENKQRKFKINMHHEDRLIIHMVGDGHNIFINESDITENLRDRNFRCFVGYHVTIFAAITVMFDITSSIGRQSFVH